MKDGYTEKYHPSSVIQDFVFSSRKSSRIRCISLQVYNKSLSSQANGTKSTEVNLVPLVCEYDTYLKTSTKIKRWYKFIFTGLWY